MGKGTFKLSDFFTEDIFAIQEHIAEVANQMLDISELLMVVVASYSHIGSPSADSLSNKPLEFSFGQGGHAGEPALRISCDTSRHLADGSAMVCACPCLCVSPQEVGWRSSCAHI